MMNKKRIIAAIMAGTLLLSGSAYGEQGGGNAKHQNQKPASAAMKQAKGAKQIIFSNAAQAAEVYALGLKQQNASLQYAMFSQAFKKKMYPQFEELNWVTGVSSPWITKWEVTKQTKINNNAESIEIRLDTATSSGPEAPILLSISLIKENSNWVIDAVTSDRDLPRSGVPVRQNGIPGFSNAEALKLAADAAARYWYIVSGGGPAKGGTGTIQEFAIKGKGDHYRWMGEDLNTKKKLFDYLSEVYTPEKVQQYWNYQIQNNSLVELKGRLAQPNADGGSLLDWSKAKANVIADDAAVKTFRFDVPSGDSEHTMIDVVFRYVVNAGWRLDTDVNRIK